MFGIGFEELFIVLLAGFLIIPSKDLPKVLATIVRKFYQLKKAIARVVEQVEQELEPIRQEVEKEIKPLKKVIQKLPEHLTFEQFDKGLKKKQKTSKSLVKRTKE